VGVAFNVSSWLPNSRDLLVDIFLSETDFDYLLCADSDIVFQPRDIATLLDAHAIVGGIVSGAYCTKEPNPELVAVREGEPLRDYPHLQPIRFAGLGFTLADRATVAILANTAPRYEHPTGLMVAGIHQSVSVGSGEDYAFYKRATDAGIACTLDLSTKVGHVGSMTFGIGSLQ
jgi:hypothetical protein